MIVSNRRQRCGSANVTHKATDVRTITGRNVTCANGDDMTITHQARNGQIETAYTPSLDGPDLISAAQICETTGSQIVLDAHGAYITKGTHKIDTGSDEFAQISKRKAGSLETYEMTAEQCNKWLGTNYVANTVKENLPAKTKSKIKRRSHRSWLEDQRNEMKEMQSQLETASLITEDNPAESFQARLCNIPGKRIAQLLRSNRLKGATGIDASLFEGTHVPESAILSRLRRIHKLRGKRETRRRKLLTTGAFDVLGPFDKRKYSTSSIEHPKYKYALVIVSPTGTEENAGTKASVIFLKTRETQEIKQKFRLWLQNLEEQSAKPATMGHVHMFQRLKSDNAQEFEGLADLFEEFGVEHVKTIPYEHYQNHTAERTIQTLQGMMRTIMTLASDVPVRMWYYAFSYAVKIFNCLPSAKGGVSAYEHQWGEPPNLKYFRVWGSTVYVRVNEEEKRYDKKIKQQRVRVGILLDCDINSRTYVVWFPDTDEITVRRNLVADERYTRWLSDRISRMRSQNKKTAKRAFMLPESFRVEFEETAQNSDSKVSEKERKIYGYVPLHTWSENEIQSKSYSIDEVFADVFRSPPPVPENLPQAETNDIRAQIAQLQRNALAKMRKEEGISTPEEQISKMSSVQQKRSGKFDGNGKDSSESHYNLRPRKNQSGNPQAFAIIDSDDSDFSGHVIMDSPDYWFMRKDGVSDKSGGENKDIDLSHLPDFYKRIDEHFKASDQINAEAKLALAARESANRIFAHAYERKSPPPQEAEDTPIGKKIQDMTTPNGRKEMLRHPYRKWLLEAEAKEIASLQKKGTWVPRKIPVGARVIGYRWVYKWKSERGIVTRAKARLCCLGYRQIPELDYFTHDATAAVLRTSHFRMLLSLVIDEFFGHAGTMDFKNAFCNGEMKKKIYLKRIPHVKLPDGTDGLLLLKSLYGLVQAPARWYDKMCEILAKCGYFPTKRDKCLFVHRDENGIPDSFLGTHVDDGICISKSPEIFDNLIRALEEQGSEVNPMLGSYGDLDYVLGLDVNMYRVADLLEVELSLRAATEILIEQYCPDAKPISTPADTKRLPKPTEPPSQEELEAQGRFPYRKIVGSLLYIAGASRPDIVFAVGACAQHCHDYRKEHIKAVVRILRYLKGTIHKWLTLKRLNLPIAILPEHEEICSKIRKQIPPNAIIGYCDSDLGACQQTRRSTGGYIFFWRGCILAYRSKRQSKVAMSTAVAEYYSLSSAAKEGIALADMVEELTGERPTIHILGDNQTANNMAELAKISDATKHIRLAEAFVKEKIDSGEIKLHFIPSGSNLSDIMTKGLGPIAHRRLSEVLIS